MRGGRKIRREGKQKEGTGERNDGEEGRENVGGGVGRGDMILSCQGHQADPSGWTPAWLPLLRGCQDLGHAHAILSHLMLLHSWCVSWSDDRKKVPGDWGHRDRVSECAPPKRA